MKRLTVPARLAAVCALALLVLGGCAKDTVRYGDARGVETVTNEFGSTDLQMIAESMTRSMLDAPIVTANNLPIVTVQEVRNKTNEYIDTRAITDSIRAELQKSGMMNPGAQGFKPKGDTGKRLTAAERADLKKKREKELRKKKREGKR